LKKKNHLKRFFKFNLKTSEIEIQAQKGKWAKVAEELERIVSPQKLMKS